MHIYGSYSAITYGSSCPNFRMAILTRASKNSFRINSASGLLSAVASLILASLLALACCAACALRTLRRCPRELGRDESELEWGREPLLLLLLVLLPPMASCILSCSFRSSSMAFVSWFATCDGCTYVYIRIHMHVCVHVYMRVRSCTNTLAYA